MKNKFSNTSQYIKISISTMSILKDIKQSIKRNEITSLYNLIKKVSMMEVLFTEEFRKRTLNKICASDKISEDDDFKLRKILTILTGKNRELLDEEYKTETPLIAVCKYGTFVMLKILTELGADINKLNSHENSCMHYLLERSYLEEDNSINSHFDTSFEYLMNKGSNKEEMYNSIPIYEIYIKHLENKLEEMKLQNENIVKQTVTQTINYIAPSLYYENPTKSMINNIIRNSKYFYY